MAVGLYRQKSHDHIHVTFFNQGSSALKPEHLGSEPKTDQYTILMSPI